MTNECDHNWVTVEIEEKVCTICNKWESENNEITYLNIEELKSLQNYFLKAGYVSHEFHEDIHLLLRKIDNILKESTDLK